MTSEYTREYTNLRATSLTREQHEQTCGYWYTVTAGTLAHTAFATLAGLERWLKERALSLEYEHGFGRYFETYSTSRIEGTYRECAHMDPGAFEALHPMLATAVLSNGDYTLGLITEAGRADNWIRTVHYLNPNVKTRIVFDHARTREVMS